MLRRQEDTSECGCRVFKELEKLGQTQAQAQVP